MLVEGEEIASDDNVGKGETLTDEEGLVKEMVVQDLKSLLHVLLCPLG